MRLNRRYRKNSIRYLRWVTKAAFLLIFLVPVAYVSRGQLVGVSSFFSAKPAYQISTFTYIQSFFAVPITQAPCSLWLSYYGDINPGLWVMDPFGGLQVLLTGQVDNSHLIPVIIAILLFVILIVLLGNVFCSWACPIGTLIDSFDKGIEKFLPKVDAKRKKRSLRSSGTQGRHLGCPLCPLGRVNGGLTNGILASALVGSAVLKFPVFCAVCPIGIVSRGMVHIKSMMSITGMWMVWWLEMFSVPIVATLLSVRGKRYWCKRLCPVGSFLSMVGALNPFIKPRVREEKCVMKVCPKDCEDAHLDLCLFCRLMDNKKCEEVCPVDINLVDHGSLAQCTKCLECYVVCDYDAVSVDFFGEPDVFSSITRLYNRIRRRSSAC